QADLWRKGLADWGQGPDRIKALRDKVDMTIYTPGSNAGLPVSILSSLDVPEFEILDDAELMAERIESTVSSLLSLVGVDADPIKDPQHILLSNIFSHAWRAGQGVTLENLIRHIQAPPFDKIGVMALDRVISESARQDLAMKLNNLLASPGFSSWLQGEPLDIKRMLHTPEGKPRISIFSIAHLSDTERMFFVALLLNQTLGWMRAQSGTTSLRALLYMDEIYGYLPPTANPPSKKPMMTMLKQARAFGLGLLLATQNPVDLDYKALSNIGTWWLGRLQTERDKMRVLDGLEGAAASGDSAFDRSKMEQLLAGLGNRVFLMNNVHEDGPAVFHVRWVMTYLRGPLARRQIKELMDPKRPAETPEQKAAKASAPLPEKPVPLRPRLPKGVAEYFVPAGAGVPGEEINYAPAVIRVGEVRYNDAKKGVNGTHEVVHVNPIDLAGGAIDWNREIELPAGMKPQQLSRDPLPGATFADLPLSLIESKVWTGMEKEFVDWLYGNESMTLFFSPLSDEHSQVGETEGDFRARLVHSAREARDKKVEELRQKFAKQIQAAEERVTKAMDELDEQKSQSNSAKLSTVMSIGTSILSAVLGGRKSSFGTTGRSAMSGASRAWKESRDVSRAEDKVDKLEEELAKLEEDCAKEVEALTSAMDPMREVFETVRLTPLKKDCDAKAVGIVWLPYRMQSQPTLGAAW
ncbi:MAG: ATP-binding protein, partial [Verrucomicrobiae bacterium]|nr:ATP-binding protein [Verrucomicrobiae bacterium]